MWYPAQWGLPSPPGKFLDGSCERGLNELAIDYLDQMRNSSAAPADFKQTIDYDKGVLLLADLDAAADRPGRLAAAEKCLATFLQQQPAHPSAISARVQLGRVLTERGRLQGRWAADPHRTSRQTDSGFQEARSHYEECSGC